MQSELIPTWNMRGVCTETRALKSQKSGEVWNHVIKITAMGGIFELNTKDADIFAKVVEGTECRANGTFEQFNGRTQFIIREIKEVTP